MEIKLSDHFTYKKLLRFVLPSVAMMIFTSIYGVVDGLFVSNFVGKSSFAAINLVIPFTMIFGGIGFMFGTGGSALVAKTLGEGEHEKANRYFSMMVWISLILGIATSAVGIAYMRQIAHFLGADAEMLEDCVVYGRLIIGFNTAFMLQNLFQSFLVTAEKPRLGLLATLAAGFTNMLLDALFVAVFDLGVAGAAIATGISQCVGGLLPLLYFLFPNNSLLRLKRTKLELRPILAASFNGVSELVTNITASVVGILYNFQLLRYAWQDGVAAYGVLMYVDFIFVAVFIGYSIGSAPIVSYHYGAGNRAELKNMLRKSVTLMVGAGICMVALAELLAVPLARLFVGYDQMLLDMTVHGFRIFSLSMLFAGFNIFSSSFFTALNNGGVSAALSFLRTFLFKLSAVLILPFFFDLDGIWLSAVAAELLAFAVSLFFILFKRKKYGY